MTRFLSRVLFDKVDPYSLAVFRIAFGAILGVEVWRYFHYDWIQAFYIAPPFHFKYYGFEWINPWPGQGMVYHFAILGILAAFVAAGFFYRISMTLLFLGFTYVFLLDQTYYLNHFYFVSLMSFLMVLAPANRVLSIDAAMSRRKNQEAIPAWNLNLMRAQVGVMYFCAGVAKLNKDWIHGRAIDTFLPDIAGSSPVVSFLLAAGGLSFDLLIVPLLLWKRTRMFAFILVLSFHVTNSFLFPIGIFPWIAIAATTLFFEPEWPRRFLAWVQLPLRQFRGTAASRASVRTAVTAFVLVYMCFQLLFPFRRWLYPGNSDWTGQGHRFSWRMMLKSKDGAIEFHVEDKDSRHRWKVSPQGYLTPKQLNLIAKTPDMALQFSHYLKDRFKNEGHPNVSIHVENKVSLNGRPSQYLIDPQVDLAAQPRSLKPSSWILPLEE